MKLFLCSLIATLAVAGCSSSGTPETRSAAAQAHSDKARPLIVDVRSAEEFESDHLPGAVNVPVSELSSRIQKVAPAKDTPLLVHCQAGGRSARAYKALQQLGYTDVRDLGSYDAAKAATQGVN
jgi:phage shock protein E